MCPSASGRARLAGACSPSPAGLAARPGADPPTRPQGRGVHGRVLPPQPQVPRLQPPGVGGSPRGPAFCLVPEMLSLCVPRTPWGAPQPTPAAQDTHTAPRCRQESRGAPGKRQGGSKGLCVTSAALPAPLGGAPQGGQGSSGAVLAGVILTDVDSCVPPPELFRFRQEPGGQHDAFRPGHPWRPVHGPWAAVGSPHPQPPRRPGAHGLPVLPADLAGVRPRDGPAGGVRGGEDGPGPEWQPPLIPPQARPAPSPPPLFLGGNF